MEVADCLNCIVFLIFTTRVASQRVLDLSEILDLPRGRFGATEAMPAVIGHDGVGTCLLVDDIRVHIRDGAVAARFGLASLEYPPTVGVFYSA